jgi:type IV secretory pathway TraG/TraD family ATPase VirD4
MLSKGNILTNSFKGFESVFTQWRMFSKMSIYIIGILLIIQIAVLSILYKYHSESYFKGFEQPDICIFKSYVLANLRHKIIPFGKLKVPYSCQGNLVYLEYDYFQGVFQQYFDTGLYPIFKRNITLLLIITSQIYWLYFILLYFLGKNHKESVKDKYIRGKVFVNDDRYSEYLEPYNNGFKITLNDKIFIPDSIVTKHHFIIGATGSGKSQLANKIIKAILDANYKCIIHDFKGDMIPSFYDEKKHYIFNPLDTRHMGLSDNDSSSPKGWSLFNELETEPNVDAFVSSMIPDGQGDPIWYTAPRDLLKAMIFYCIHNNMYKNEDLLNIIETSPSELREFFEVTPGCRIGLKHLEEGKLAGQFMSILATYTASLQYLKETDGEFSIRKWIADPDSEKRIIFLANQAEVQKTLRTLISTFFDFSIKALCTLADDSENRRMYFILDEFGQLGKMDSIIQLLTQGRSKGASSWIFIQDMGQIEHIYGRDHSKTIINGCRSKYYFNVADNPTADFISKEIGTVEYQRTKESKSFGVSDLKDSISINDEVVEKPIAIPSQIKNLKNLTFYLQLSDIPEITQTSITYAKFPQNKEAFVPRDLRIKSRLAASGIAVASSNTFDSIVKIEELKQTEVSIETSIFSKMADLQDILESNETPVDESEIPDLSNVKFDFVKCSEPITKISTETVNNN